MRHIHLIGIAGVGMRALAKMLLDAGYIVSGSDLKTSSAVDYLSQQGLKFTVGHKPENINDAEVVVRSSAITDNNPEWQAAIASKNLQLMHRAEMLQYLAKDRQVIAVTGSHGKTSTTAMIAHVLTTAGFNPSFAIGSSWANPCGAKLTTSNYLVIEADESDASFLHLKPYIGLALNIEPEHMDFYQQSPEKLYKAFAEFLKSSQHVVYWQNDPVLQSILPESTHAASFAVNAAATISVDDLGVSDGLQHYQLGSIKGFWSIIGSHQLENLAAAYAVCQQLGVAAETFITAMASFILPGRRFEERGNWSKSQVLVVDDYGHHPTEIIATIKAARLKYPDKRLVMAFQPHKYSRLRDEFSGFVKALSTVDHLILLDVYPAGEQLIPGYTSTELGQNLTCVRIADVYEAKIYCQKALMDNDLLICQGAGDITLLADALLEKVDV